MVESQAGRECTCEYSSGVETVAAIPALACVKLLLAQASLRSMGMRLSSSSLFVSYAVTCVHFHLKYTINRNLGGEMAWYKAKVHF